MMERPEEQARDVFAMMEEIPSQVYFGFAVGSTLASAIAYLLGRRHLALFIGQWPPTFLALTLFYKLLRPSREEVMPGMRRAGEEARRVAEEMRRAG